MAALAERYRIERELGAGGMATVYPAEDLKHHRQVAVKVLRPELSALLGADRFVKEIELTVGGSPWVSDWEKQFKAQSPRSATPGGSGRRPW